MRNMIVTLIITTVYINCIVLPVHAGMGSDSYSISSFVLSCGGGPMDSDNYQTDITLGQPLYLTKQESESYTLQSGFWQTVEAEPLLDYDSDGIPDSHDNCRAAYNPGQEDIYPPDGNTCGDACECEGNFDGDEDQDGLDAFTFKVDFGRSTFLNPCTPDNPCNGNFDCDEDVDGANAFTFKEDFGRSRLGNPCPNCVTVPWCE